MGPYIKLSAFTLSHLPVNSTITARQDILGTGMGVRVLPGEGVRPANRGRV
jgi:hypothetical protein